MNTKAFFDEQTFTLTYVVYDSASKDAVVIDPVLDLDPLAWRTSTISVEKVKQFVSDNGLRVRYILDTHAHADHLSGMEVLRSAFSAPTAIGERITVVQKTFAEMYNLKDFPADGRQWDTLLSDGSQLVAGSIQLNAIHTPGHTPACMSYLIGDAVFTGDALFMPDYGTGRCDFPNGSANDLYNSVTKRLYSLPDSTRVFVGHDYLPEGRAMEYQTTIGDSKQKNVRLRAATPESEFVEKREARDRELAPPKLILQSLQVNIDAGNLPKPDDNGRRYFRIPIDTLGRSAAG